MSIQTPEQIADAAMSAFTVTDVDEDLNPEGDVEEISYGFIREAILDAIVADRAQRQPEIYIVQNDGGEVIDVFRDADEANAAYQFTESGLAYSIIEETVTEPGEYAEPRIAELTAAWEESTGDTASDYQLSEDDWAFGLGEDDAREIARLIEWKKENAS